MQETKLVRTEKKMKQQRKKSQQQHEQQQYILLLGGDVFFVGQPKTGFGRRHQQFLYTIRKQSTKCKISTVNVNYVYINMKRTSGYWEIEQAEEAWCEYKV